MILKKHNLLIQLFYSLIAIKVKNLIKFVNFVVTKHYF